MLFADGALARRLERNTAKGGVKSVESLKRMGASPEARYIEVAGGYAIYAGKNMPFNRADGVGLNGPVAPEELDKLENFYAEVGLPARLEICPYTDPTLVKLLCERGYRITGFFNQHFRPLSPADASPALIEGVQVIRVAKGTDEAQSWVRVVAGAFGGKDEEEQNQGNLILPTSNLNREDVSCFLATMDGELAGGGAMAIREGLASFFSTATLPKFGLKGYRRL